MKKIVIALVACTAICGCWTFNETEFPESEVTKASDKAKELAISVTGFSALLTEYEAVHGFQTVYVPGYCSRYYCDPGRFETMPTVSFLPQRRTTDMFLRRAVDAFEAAGFTVGAIKCDRTVEVTFEGPFVSSDADLKKMCWELLTLFFCDYGSSRWTAKLRIRDTVSGRLLYHRDYYQDYETNVFGLIPLFGISSRRETTPAHMQSWCLAALTDQAVADATAFLAK